MKVILQKDVLNLGDAGEVKEVPSGYARNFLIPRKLVIPVRGNSIRALDHQKKMLSLRKEKREKEMQELATKLSSLKEVEVVVRIGAKNKLFGAVTNHHIAMAVKEAGFLIDKRKIEMNDTIKALGSFPVKLRLAEKITVPLTVNVIPDPEDVAVQLEIEETARRHDKKKQPEAQEAPVEEATEQPEQEESEAGE